MSQIKVELQDWLGDDRAIASSAWTSSLDYQRKKNRSEDDVKRVINLLADQKHSVPFESVVLRFWIKMPIATDRQFCTHRIASHSGMSGRYRTMPSEYLDVPNDVDSIIDKVMGVGDYNIQTKYLNLCLQANEFYKQVNNQFKEAEKNNIISNSEYKRTREFFRGVLPQHNMTERVTTINLRSFSNFIKLRLSEHAQPEIRQVAQMMLDVVENANVCPIAIEALKRNNWSI